MRRSLQNLISNSTRRGDGYMADVLSHATEVNQKEKWYVLRAGAFEMLRAKWAPPTEPKKPHPATGTILRNLIESEFGVQQCDDGCGDLAATMDARGPAWCEANRAKIVDQMLARSDKLRWYQRWAVALAPEIARAKADELVRRAIETVNARPASGPPRL